MQARKFIVSTRLIQQQSRPQQQQKMCSFSTNVSMNAMATRTTNNNNGKPMRDDSQASGSHYFSSIDWHATYAKSVEVADDSKVFDAEQDFSDCGQADFFEDAFGSGAALRRKFDKEIAKGWVNRH